MVSSRVTRRRRFPSYRKIVRPVDEALESASSIKIRSHRSPRFMMCASKLDSQFAGHLGRVVSNRSIYQYQEPTFLQYQELIHLFTILAPPAAGGWFSG
jgi:hypothetical protein